MDVLAILRCSSARAGAPRSRPMPMSAGRTARARRASPSSVGRGSRSPAQ